MPSLPFSATSTFNIDPANSVNTASYCDTLSRGHKNSLCVIIVVEFYNNYYDDIQE